MFGKELVCGGGCAPFFDTRCSASDAVTEPAVVCCDVLFAVLRQFITAYCLVALQAAAAATRRSEQQVVLKEQRHERFRNILRRIRGCRHLVQQAEQILYQK